MPPKVSREGNVVQNVVVKVGGDEAPRRAPAKKKRVVRKKKVATKKKGGGGAVGVPMPAPVDYRSVFRSGTGGGGASSSSTPVINNYITPPSGPSMAQMMSAFDERISVLQAARAPKMAAVPVQGFDPREVFSAETSSDIAIVPPGPEPAPISITSGREDLKPFSTPPAVKTSPGDSMDGVESFGQGIPPRPKVVPSFPGFDSQDMSGVKENVSVGGARPGRVAQTPLNPSASDFVPGGFATQVFEPMGSSGSARAQIFGGLSESAGDEVMGPNNDKPTKSDGSGIGVIAGPMARDGSVESVANAPVKKPSRFTEKKPSRFTTVKIPEKELSEYKRAVFDDEDGENVRQRAASVARGIEREIIGGNAQNTARMLEMLGIEDSPPLGLRDRQESVSTAVRPGTPSLKEKEKKGRMGSEGSPSVGGGGPISPGDSGAPPRPRGRVITSYAGLSFDDTYGDFMRSPTDFNVNEIIQRHKTRPTLVKTEDKKEFQKRIQEEYPEVWKAIDYKPSLKTMNPTGPHIDTMIDALQQYFARGGTAKPGTPSR